MAAFTGRRSPIKEFIRVLLPEPTSPMRQMSSPFLIWRLMFFSWMTLSRGWSLVRIYFSSSMESEGLESDTPQEKYPFEIWMEFSLCLVSVIYLQFISSNLLISEISLLSEIKT